ncbi:enoyl-CoA hydratase/isomerase family protein [bacterium]|nr:enoyl-CoA hydratase/isomerase family protein [bacterium]
MSFIQVEESGRIETWTINRPERFNALGTTLARELNERVDDLHRRLVDWQASPSANVLPVRALVITTQPSRRGRSPVWIAGGDMKELATLTGEGEGKNYAAMLNRFCRCLEELPIPVIASIHGAAIGGGAELALAADLRFGTRMTRFEFRQLRVGLATGYGGTKRLVNLIGKANAQRLIYLGGDILAEECLRMGLLHHVAIDEHALADMVAQTARDIVSLEPRALAAQKEMFRIATDAHPGAAYSAELELFGKIWMNPSHKNFLASF